MKMLLVVLGAAVATLGLYASGFVTAVAFLSAEPTPVWKPNRDEGGLWTLEPVTVSGRDQDFERLPARRPAGATLVASAAAADEAWASDAIGGPVDGTPTASIGGGEVSESGESMPEPAGAWGGARDADAAVAAHVRWCESRYRSYRLEDDSFTPYGGGRRACTSPYSEAGRRPERATDAYARAEVATEPLTALSSRHIQSCFDRYRSYRPSDNSYQPYGGGPRRQCR